MKDKLILRMRISSADIHYGGGLVPGSKIVGLFGDAATALLIRKDGDEGLFAAYESIEFKAPVYAGDFLEIHALISNVGNSSRAMSFEAWKIIAANPQEGESAADWLEEPQLVATAKATCVVPKSRQRR